MGHFFFHASDVSSHSFIHIYLQKTEAKGDVGTNFRLDKQLAPQLGEILSRCNVLKSQYSVLSMLLSCQLSAVDVGCLDLAAVRHSIKREKQRARREYSIESRLCNYIIDGNPIRVVTVFCYGVNTARRSSVHATASGRKEVWRLYNRERMWQY